jgi:hypothetical protein
MKSWRYQLESAVRLILLSSRMLAAAASTVGLNAWVVARLVFPRELGFGGLAAWGVLE